MTLRITTLFEYSTPWAEYLANKWVRWTYRETRSSFVAIRYLGEGTNPATDISIHKDRPRYLNSRDKAFNFIEKHTPGKYGLMMRSAIVQYIQGGRLAASFPPTSHVRYDPTRELGYVTSTNNDYVFVRFEGDTHSKACYPEDLTVLTDERHT